METYKRLSTKIIKSKLVQCDWCGEVNRIVFEENHTPPKSYRCDSCSHLNIPALHEDTSAEYDNFCKSKYNELTDKGIFDGTYEDFLISHNYKKDFFQEKIISLTIFNTTTEKSLIKHLNFWGNIVSVRLKSVKIYANSYQWQIDRIYTLNTAILFLTDN